jgi:predicted RNA-binding Zn ribbon-like protein
VDLTHDTRVTLATAAALANTAPRPGRAEGLPDAAALDAFLERWHWSHRVVAPEDLADVHALRDRVRTLWDLPLPRLVEEVNALLAENDALPQLVEHGPEFGWHVHATRPGAPLGRTMAVEVAMALVDLIRSDDADRLRTCAGEDCDDVVVDLSRNRSRRYCEGTCANRAHVAAYRARHRAEGDD